MLDFKKVMHTSIENGYLDFEKLQSIIIDMFYDVKKNDKEMYEDLTLEFYEDIYGHKICKEMAYDIVRNMKPIGEKWTFDQVSPLNKGHDPVEFYIVMNMLYNDYYHLIGNDNSMYVKFADAWFNDIDGKKHKTFDYFMK